ncbi:MAG: hypothetical protein AAF557_20305, partial [Pseudomonadota bacterium]
MNASLGMMHNFQGSTKAKIANMLLRYVPLSIRSYLASDNMTGHGVGVYKHSPDRDGKAVHIHHEGHTQR